MGKFEVITLPKALVEAQKKEKALRYEQLEVASKLDYDDEFGDHECDCQWCETNTDPREPLDWDKREELEAEHEANEKLLSDLALDISAMLRYKTFIEKKKA